MSFVRPELARVFGKWAEPAVAVLCAAGGVWLATRGGWFLFVAGLLVWAVAGGWALIALRRMTFLRAPDAPGVVEVDEGQLGYFAPDFGGFIALSDLAEISLIGGPGGRSWRLRTADGQFLTVPVGSVGADRLYDAFAVLPGIDMGRIAEALDGDAQVAPLWTRPGRIAVAPFDLAGASHHEKS